MQVPLTTINIPWNKVIVEEWPSNDGSWGQVQRRGSNKALMGWRLWLLRPGVGGFPWPEVRALLDGGALRDGLGCGGEGGVGPTQVWYLLGARVATEEPTVVLP